MASNSDCKTSSYSRYGLDVIQSSLKFGILSGGLGTFLGSFWGIMRSKHPLIFTLASGLQWFAVGTIYWASRTMIIGTQSNWVENVRRASGAAAAIAGGSTGFIASGRRSILPRAIVFGTLGFTTQDVYNRASTLDMASSDWARKVFDKMIQDRPWIPFQVLDDCKYRAMLQEKLIRVRSEIAVLEEDVRNLQCKSKET